MPLDPLQVCAAARLAEGDLREIDRQLTNGGEVNAQWLLLVKFALVSVANLADLELRIRSLYRSHPEISAEFKKHVNQFAFAKYVRNILVGHTNDALIAKAIEWKPELLTLLIESKEDATFLINLFILETALNTYVDKDQKHLVFGDDTDLLFPPDWERFLKFMTDVVRGGLAFLVALSKVVRSEIPPPPEGRELMLRYAKAGETTFSRIKKSRRS